MTFQTAIFVFICSLGIHLAEAAEPTTLRGTAVCAASPSPCQLKIYKDTLSEQTFELYSADGASPWCEQALSGKYIEAVGELKGRKLNLYRYSFKMPPMIGLRKVAGRP